MTNAAKPSRYIVDLSVEQRARLEEHRARLGFRSMADVIRHWIDAPERAGTGKLTRVKLGFAPPMDFEADNPARTFGPVSPKPGSRLKKGKG